MLRLTDKEASEDLKRALDRTFVSFGPIRPPSRKPLPEDKVKPKPTNEEAEQELQTKLDEEDTPAG